MIELESFGRIILVMGIFLALLGIALIFGEKIGLGKLPGDIYIQKGNFTFFFPIVSSLLISLLLTLILRIFRK
ncbi:MAG TPA: DUF2905 domain-containing protein [Tepidimicrobium sp.]|nr:DUF2905 domain-containing protein [Tepidimicrobium sp.]